MGVSAQNRRPNRRFLLHWRLSVLYGIADVAAAVPLVASTSCGIYCVQLVDVHRAMVPHPDKLVHQRIAAAIQGSESLSTGITVLHRIGDGRRGCRLHHQHFGDTSQFPGGVFAMVRIASLGGEGKRMALVFAFTLCYTGLRLELGYSWSSTMTQARMRYDRH